MAPPAMLKYQKAMGTTLRRRRSLASHWMRKRMPNIACPTKPRTSQKVTLSTNQSSVTEPGGGVRRTSQ